jgi:hypothetical protein
VLADAHACLRRSLDHRQCSDFDMRRRPQNTSLKLLQSVSYDVEHALHGVVIDEGVKERKAATTVRSPASSSQRAPSPRCRASAALSQRIESKLRSALIDLSCGLPRNSVAQRCLRKAPRVSRLWSMSAAAAKDAAGFLKLRFLAVV